MEKLNANNLKIHESKNGVEPNKHAKVCEQTEDQSTQASICYGLTAYMVPEFSDELINDLTNENDIIFNKNYKQETYKNNALFYIYLTYKGRTVKLYAYGYKPEGFKNIDNLGNLYFVCAEWFILDIFNPLTQGQFYKLTPIIYNFDHHREK